MNDVYSSSFESKLDPVFRSSWTPTSEYKRQYYWEPTYSEEWIEQILIEQYEGWQEGGCQEDE